MFIVIKSEHYDCTNLICKKDTLEEAVATVKDSMAQRINKNYHAGLTGTDITHENEDHYGFSFTFDENRNADSSEPRAYSTYASLKCSCPKSLVSFASSWKTTSFSSAPWMFARRWAIPT